MNILKKLRSKKVSLFLVSIFLLYSCEINHFTNDLVSLETTVQIHKSLSDEMLLLLKDNKKKEIIISHKYLKTKDNAFFFASNEDYRTYLEVNGFSNIDEIIDLSDKIKNNLIPFIKYEQSNNPDITQEEIIEKISLELRNQLNKNHKTFNKSVDYCQKQLDTAEENCNENFYISSTASVVVGFFTLGIGAAVGIAVSTAIMVKCHEDSVEAYKKCKEYVESL